MGRYTGSVERLSIDLLWGRMLRQPGRHEIAAPVEEQLIIEHYAR